MSKSKPSSNGFTLFNLAKKMTGLKSAEKRVAVAMADKIRKVDGVCNASLETLANEFGGSKRDLRYGLHGRTIKDKAGNVRWSFPGVLGRGLFVAVMEHNQHEPTVYRACLENWKQFLPEKHHEWWDHVRGEQCSDSEGNSDASQSGTVGTPERHSNPVQSGTNAANTLIETLIETQREGETQEARAEKAALPPSKPNGQNLTELVKVLAKEVDPSTSFSKASDAEITQAIADVNITEPELRKHVPERVRKMDEHERRRAGSILGQELAAIVQARRNAETGNTEAQRQVAKIEKRQEALAANAARLAEKRQAEVVQQLAAIRKANEQPATIADQPF